MLSNGTVSALKSSSAVSGYKDSFPLAEILPVCSTTAENSKENIASACKLNLAKFILIAVKCTWVATYVVLSVSFNWLFTRLILSIASCSCCGAVVLLCGLAPFSLGLSSLVLGGNICSKFSSPLLLRMTFIKLSVSTISSSVAWFSGNE